MSLIHNTKRHPLTLQLSQALYERVTEWAAAQRQTPDRLIEAWLTEQLLPTHPYVEITHSRSGPRAVIRGTRVGVEVVAGYAHAGNSPQTIVADILPHLTLAQVYDALSYAEDHHAEMLEIAQANTPEAWQARVREQLRTSADRLLGN